MTWKTQEEHEKVSNIIKGYNEWRLKHAAKQEGIKEERSRYEKKPSKKITKIKTDYGFLRKRVVVHPIKFDIIGKRATIRIKSH